MPRQKIDPLERVLDAYFQLDSEQQRIFKICMSVSGRCGEPTSNNAPVPAKRGRPKGSRNIQISEPLRSVVNSIVPNAATEEGL